MWPDYVNGDLWISSFSYMPVNYSYFFFNFFIAANEFKGLKFSIWFKIYPFSPLIVNFIIGSEALFKVLHGIFYVIFLFKISVVLFGIFI